MSTNIKQIDFNSDEEFEIDIIDLAELQQRTAGLSHDPTQPHRVSFNLLIYIEQGQGHHFIDFEYYPFNAGSFIFVHKDQVHAFDFKQTITGKAILFTAAFIDAIQANINLTGFLYDYLTQRYQPVVIPNAMLLSSTTQLLTEMLVESVREDRSSVVLMLLFSSLYLMLERERPQQVSALTATQSTILTRFIMLLTENPKSITDATDYALQLHTTYKTLNQICKRASSMTAKQFIDAYRMVEIKRSLILESKQVQQVAYDFGFDDTSNFVKYFKTQAQMTPLQFIKKNRG